MFENHRIWETQFVGEKITIETGKLAPLAGASCLVTYGDTVILCTATASKDAREGMNFFPLSVDFEEKLYARGKIPGSFMRREGRPSDKAVLASRLVDRPIRPLFPAGMRNDVACVMTILSYDPDFSPEIAGMIGVSAALSISDIPWNGPIAGISVGLVDGELVFMPNKEQRDLSEMEVTVAATKEKVVMLEMGGKEVPDEIVYDAIIKGHEKMQSVIELIETMTKEIGKEKFEFAPEVVPEAMFLDIKNAFENDVKDAITSADKNIRDQKMQIIKAKVQEDFLEKYEDEKRFFGDAISSVEEHILRKLLLEEGKRVDGRGLSEIRELASEVSLLPRTHGSGLFTRGETQVMSIVTLGAMREAQFLDGLDDETEKRYMHHYNFPSYSVGETRPNRGPGRRELGHGALAEKALLSVIPDKEDFPYAIRVVSEVLSSNGSTSQGAVCASTLALMDAGVPLKSPVAGISCGVVTQGDRHITFTDIQGIEDFYGDMDFKVAGSHKGITAIQLDIKNDGLTPQIIKEALDKTKVGREQILDEVMLKAIDKPREELSEYAPKMYTLTIHPDKIREVIGSGGKIIQRITAEFDVKIDIEDDGSVYVAGVDAVKTQAALETIKIIAYDPEIGAIYQGVVTRVMDFGAFVEIAPGKEGLVHISQLANHHVKKVEDVVKTGDAIPVKVMEIDDLHRINLSLKQAQDDEKANGKN